MSWEKVRLSELYTVHNGLSKGRKFFGSGYPFLSFSTVFNNYFIPKELTDLVQTDSKEQKNYSILRGDVFVTRTSETSDELGMSCVALKDYPQATYNGFTKRMRPIDKDRVLPEYIGYYMRMPSFRGEFQAFSTMTTRASLKNEDLLSLTITLPPMEQQEKISQILRNYDNLIENNQKQIKLLEEAAQRLYKQWFVDLRFPGHENVKIVDGVPEGWSTQTVEELSCVLRRGISPKYNEKAKYMVINQKCIRQSVMDIAEARPQEKTYPAELNLQDSDVVICSTGTGTLGRVGQVYGNYANTTFDSHVTIVRASTDAGTQFLYHAIKSNQIYLMGCGKGSTNQQELNRDVIKAVKVLVPTNKLLAAFENQAQAIHDKIRNLRDQTLLATEARDRLLPKLMSGEIEV